MAKYSPTPWRFGNGYVLDASNNVVPIEGIAQPRGVTAHDDVAWANARLIAAAPELLEACKKIMQLVESGVLVRDTSRDTETGWALHQLPMLLFYGKVMVPRVPQLDNIAVQALQKTLKETMAAISKAEGRA